MWFRAGDRVVVVIHPLAAHLSERFFTDAGRRGTVVQTLDGQPAQQVEVQLDGGGLHWFVSKLLVVLADGARRTFSGIGEDFIRWR